MSNFLRWRRSVTEERPGAANTEPGTTAASDIMPGLSPEMIELMLELQRRLAERTQPLLAQFCTALNPKADNETRYRTAEALAGAVYPTYKFSEYGRLFLEDRAFLEYYRRFMDPGNWHSLDRKYTLDQLLKLVQHLDGDLAECGAYRGFSAYRLCLAARNSSKLVHLFDSFAGLSAPGPWDGDYWTAGGLRSSEVALQETLAEFDNYRIYRGWIPERFGEVSDRRFSFVHIDVDLYQPTRESLEFFYPRTPRQGIILMDDYGFSTCPGAKHAVDEFFANKSEPVVMLTTGQALVLKR